MSLTAIYIIIILVTILIVAVLVMIYIKGTNQQYEEYCKLFDNEEQENKNINNK